MNRDGAADAADAAGAAGVNAGGGERVDAMGRALSLAAGALGRTSPNPAVGAVIVDRAGTIVGEGATRPYGFAHAEPLALAMAGDLARGATLYATLEPCSHHGKTPPCADAVIAAGIERVVVATLDPNPRVAGRGVARLREAGIAVEIGPSANEARTLMGGFATWIATRRPLVVAKFASSLDGRIATRSGDSRWISGPDARRWAHGVRDWVDAILVGVGTVRADDPALTCRVDESSPRYPRTRHPQSPFPVATALPLLHPSTRLPHASCAPSPVATDPHASCAPSPVAVACASVGGSGEGLSDPLLASVVPVRSGHPPRQPLRVILDTNLCTPIGSQVASGLLDGTSLIVGVDDGSAAWAARRTALSRPSVEVVSVAAGSDGRPEAAAVLDLLGERGVTTLLVEGGATVHASFFGAGLVDRVAAVVAPVVIGGGPSAVGSALTGPTLLADAWRLAECTVSRLGEDVLVSGWLRFPMWA